MGGDVLLRIVVLGLLADTTNSTFRIGLILAAPALGGWVARTLFPFARWGPRQLMRLGVLIELGRAIALGFLNITPSVDMAVSTLVLTGAVQGPFEGAFGVAMQRAHGGADVRVANSWLRMGILLVSALVAGAAIRIPCSVAGASALNLATFLGSACTLAWFAQRETHEEPSISDAAPGNPARSLEFEWTATIYVAAAVGLAIAAPSMVGVARESLASWSLEARAAYAVYSLSVATGALVGGLYLLGRVNDPPRFLVSAMGIMVGATVWLGVSHAPISLLFTSAASAFAEIVLAVEVGTRAQLDFGARGCATALSAFRSRLALAAALGLAINVSIATWMSRVTLVTVASGIGIVCVTLASAKARSQQGGSQALLHPPRPLHGDGMNE